MISYDIIINFLYALLRISTNPVESDSLQLTVKQQEDLKMKEYKIIQKELRFTTLTLLIGHLKFRSTRSSVLAYFLEKDCTVGAL